MLIKGNHGGGGRGIHLESVNTELQALAAPGEALARPSRAQEGDIWDPRA